MSARKRTTHVDRWCEARGQWETVEVELLRPSEEEFDACRRILAQRKAELRVETDETIREFLASEVEWRAKDLIEWGERTK